MTDLVTIGTLAASALAMASDETVKGFVGEAVKDAYKKLKDKIARIGRALTFTRLKKRLPRKLGKELSPRRSTASLPKSKPR